MDVALPPLKGLRNGLYYGGKVRFVHSLVMMLLFKDINKSNIKQILKFTMEHALNLGKFVFLYKLSCILLEKIYKKTSLNNFIAGFVCGYFIWGHKTPVNYQIVLYLFSRILIGLADMVYKKIQKRNGRKDSKPGKMIYPLFAALIWGIVMWIFEVDKDSLQASLTSSMEFLYNKSNEALRDWSELVPFYIPDAVRKLFA